MNELLDCVETGNEFLQKDVEKALDLLEEYLNNDWKNKLTGDSL